MLHPAITVVRAVALCLAVLLRPAAASASDHAHDNVHDNAHGAMAMSLAAARELVGRDPPQALAVIGRLRREAASAGLLDARLAADELECRLRSDLDPEGALRVAEAGIAATRDGAARPSPSPLPLLRLRVCRAAGLIDAEHEADGLAELDRVIAAAADPVLAPARGLALMERGTARSRAGALTDGQRDLLAACALLAEQPRDGELCNAYLANHYRRVGDLDEALPLARRLLDGARRQGARFDESVYLMILAQIHSQRGEHAQALAGYAEAERFAGVTQDPQGLVKAAYGTALSLLASIYVPMLNVYGAESTVGPQRGGAVSGDGVRAEDGGDDVQVQQGDRRVLVRQCGLGQVYRRRSRAVARSDRCVAGRVEQRGVVAPDRLDDALPGLRSLAERRQVGLRRIQSRSPRLRVTGTPRDVSDNAEHIGESGHAADVTAAASRCQFNPGSVCG